MFLPIDMVLQTFDPPFTSPLPSGAPFLGMAATPWNVTLFIYSQPSQPSIQVPTHQHIEDIPHFPISQLVQVTLQIIQPIQVVYNAN